MASTYTFRIEHEDGNPIVWIDRDGNQIIRQPHHPSAVHNAPWASDAEAQEWAQTAVEQLAAQEAAVEAAQAAEHARNAQAAVDSQKLTEIHEMLTQLLAK